MSVEGPVPPARSPGSRVTAAGVGALMVFIAAAACNRNTGNPYVALTAGGPAGGGVAEVRVDRCGTGWCEGLWVGPSADRAVRVTLLAKGERCDEIAWTPDGKRVAFLVSGHQLWLFDAATQSPAGRLNLVDADRTPTSRVARGVTFSSNGKAITFDDCPRGRSGCKPGMIAIR